MAWNKRLYVLHGWLGLNFGLVLFIVCFSGTVAVVSHEIDWLLTPDLRVTPQATRASYGEMYRAVQQRYPDTPARFAWAPVGPRFAAEFWLLPETGGRRRVYVDPYTAQVLGEGSWFNTQRFFRDFHRRFFWYTWWGIWLVAAFGFVLLASSITGMMFYKRWWAKLLTLRWYKGGRVFWSDVHRLAGAWTLVFAAIIAVTGIWYFVEIPLSWGAEAAPAPSVPKSSFEARSPADRLPIEQCVGIAQKTIPGFEVGAIWFPAKPSDPLRIDGQAAAWLVRDRANRVLIDPYTGDVLFWQRAEQLDLLDRWTDTADPLHFGNFAGLPSKLVWFVFGLGLSLLMPTGAYLWTRRAAQIASSTGTRLQRAAGVLTDREIERHVRWATGRQTALGIASTTAILLLTIYATYGALAKQFSEAEMYGAGMRALGGTGAVAVYATFMLLILIVTAFWYRCIWFPSRT